jgi:hypothetical protein
VVRVACMTSDRLVLRWDRAHSKGQAKKENDNRNRELAALEMTSDERGGGERERERERRFAYQGRVSFEGA